MTSMKAVRIYSYGGPEVLSFEDAPRPHPGAGEVLVRVRASGVNPVDWKVREGYLREGVHHTLPLILGWDVSGEIEAVGFGVNRLKLHDEVYSRPDIARDGSYAEYIVIRESEVALKPKTLDHIQSAAIPLAGLTAWQTLFGAGFLQAGQKVLIHAGAGGVGGYAVQLAKWKGAVVFATSSTRNLDLLRQLGADEAIDYTAGPFEEAVKNVDLVLDTMGGDTQAHSWKTLKRGGILVSIVDPPDQDLAVAHGVRAAYVFIEPNAFQLAEIAELADSGVLKPVVETVLPLAEARRAQELSQSGHARGKIVLEIG